MTEAIIKTPLRERANGDGAPRRRRRTAQVEIGEGFVSVRMCDYRGRLESGPRLMIEARSDGWAAVCQRSPDGAHVGTFHFYDDASSGFVAVDASPAA